jgi:hypothetical protein
MRSIWKGLIVGGLTGALVGAAADLGQSGSRSLGTAGRRARRYGPQASDKVKGAAVSGVNRVETAVNRGLDQLEQANLPERAAEMVNTVGDKVSHAKIQERAIGTTNRAAAGVGDKARTVRSSTRKAS